jgi:hypothetical protein
MENNKVKPLTLEIDIGLWERFKELTPRTKTLNDAVIELIEKEVKKYEN